MTNKKLQLIEQRKTLAQKLSELTKKHGDSAGWLTPDGRTLAIVPPSEEAYLSFFNSLSSTSNRAEARRQFALSCVALPTREEAGKIFARYPALFKKTSDAAERLGGAHIAEGVPSAEQIEKYGSDIAVFNTPDGRTLIYGPPSEGDYDRCMNTIDEAADRAAVIRELVVCSLKSPSPEDALLVFKRYPALMTASGHAVQRLGGAEIEELGKD